MTVPPAPFPEAGEVTEAPDATPQDIADEFLAAAQAAGDESGNKIESATKRKRRTASAAPADGVPDDALPKWTPDGIGTAVAFAVNFGFMRGDMVPLEPEEEVKVKTIAAYYANYRFPKAAKIQPEAVIIALALELVGPRLAAKRAAAAAQPPQGLERST